MRDYRDAKAMAKALRTALADRQVTISHSEALELVARQFDLADWNTLSAKIQDEERPEDRPVLLARETAPILRIFDEAKAREFYLDFLGFALAFEHRFGDNFPLYAGVERAGLVLHLSGHHGDATPGATVFVRVTGIRAFQRELAAKDYAHMKPGLEELPWGLVMEVTDPFQNRIRFCEDPAG